MESWGFWEWALVVTIIVAVILVMVRVFGGQGAVLAIFEGLAEVVGSSGDDDD